VAGPHPVVALDQEGLLGLAESPPVLLGHSADGGHVLGYQVELRLAGSRGKAGEREQVDARLLELA
jgi:hypothetical protein